MRQIVSDNIVITVLPIAKVVYVVNKVTRNSLMLDRKELKELIKSLVDIDKAMDEEHGDE